MTEIDKKKIIMTISQEVAPQVIASNEMTKQSHNIIMLHTMRLLRYARNDGEIDFLRIHHDDPAVYNLSFHHKSRSVAHILERGARMLKPPIRTPLNHSMLFSNASTSSGVMSLALPSITMSFLLEEAMCLQSASFKP